MILVWSGLSTKVDTNSMSDNHVMYVCPIDHNIMTNHKIGCLNIDKYAKLHRAATVENILNQC
jgi:hypothetical protein